MSISSPTSNTPTLEASAPAPKAPPNVMDALRRNPFIADERGQAMVEMVIIGPLLLFLLVSIWHFHTLSTQRLNFLIDQRNVAFNAILGNTTTQLGDASYSVVGGSSDSGFGTGQWLGFDFLDIRNVIRLYPTAQLMMRSGTNPKQNGVMAAFAVFRGGRSAFSQVENIGSFNIDQVFGTPYEAMGLRAASYYQPTGSHGQTPRVNKVEIDNPYRGVLLGMGTYFMPRMGSAHDMDRIGGLEYEKFPIVARFPIITDPWKADFQSGATTRAQVEGVIQERAGGVTFFENLYGVGIQIGMGVTSVMEPWLIRKWLHMPYKYKVDGRTASNSKGSMRANEISTRPLKLLTGNNLIDSWR